MLKPFNTFHCKGNGFRLSFNNTVYDCGTLWFYPQRSGLQKSWLEPNIHESPRQTQIQRSKKIVMDNLKNRLTYLVFCFSPNGY